MEYKYKRKLVSEYQVTEIQQNIEMGIYCLAAFAIPFLLSHPQMLIGVLVNAALVLSALRLSWHRTLPVIFMPSVAVFLSGTIFGGLTPSLLLLIPFIWIANILLVILTSELKKKTGVVSSTGIGIAAKVTFLSISAAILISFGVIPAVLFVSMSVVQLSTAVIGSGAALAINQLLIMYFRSTK